MLDQQLDLIHNIIHLLNKIQTPEVKTAEQQLMALAESPKFVNSLIYIISAPSQQDWIKLSASTTLSQVLMKKIDHDKVNNLIQIFDKIFNNQYINKKNKRCFQNLLVRALSTQEQSFLIQMRSRVAYYLSQRKNYDTAYLILNSFALADCIVDHLVFLIKNHFQQIIVSLEICHENADLIVNMLKLLIVIIDKLKIQQEENYQNLRNILTSDRLVNLIEIIYEYSTTEKIYLCIDQTESQINIVKGLAADIHKQIISFYLRYIEEDSFASMPYHFKHLQKIIRTLYLIAHQKQYIQVLECQQLITNFVTILNGLIMLDNNCLDYLTSTQIQDYFIFVILCPDDEERQKFEENPVEFNALAEDCCDHQTFGILKTQTAKLLQTLGDKIPGSESYALTRALESLKIKLQFIQPPFYAQNLTILEIQTSFLILSIFSYRISKYSQIKDALRIILQDNRMFKLNPFQIARIFTFLAYNFTQIFGDQMGQQWFIFAFTYIAHPTTQYSGIDFIDNNIQDFYSPKFIPYILAHLQTSKNGLIWQIISKLITTHYPKLSEQIISNILLKVGLRIQKQIDALQKNQKRDTLDIINCLRLYHLVSKRMLNDDQPYLNSIKKQNLINNILKILPFYQIISKYDIQDEIVKIATSIINNLPYIHQQVQKYLPIFLNTFKYNGYFQIQYITFFNQFIMKANFQNNQSSLLSIFSTIKDAVLHSIMKMQIQKSTMSNIRITLCNHLVVLQNIFAIYGKDLVFHNCYNYIAQVSSLCVRILPNQQTQILKTTSSKIIYSRAFNLLFIIHMNSNIETIYTYLQRLYKQNIYHGYDSQVIMTCIGKFLFNQTDFSIINLLLTSIINIVYDSQIKKQKIQKKKNKKIKVIKDLQQIQIFQKMNKLIKKIDTPFQNSSIVDQLIQIVIRMKSSNPGGFQALMSNLQSNILVMLKKYIDIDVVQKKERVIRKVRGIKQGGVVEISQKKVNRYKGEDEMDGQDSDAQYGKKRERMIIKGQKKKKKKKNQNLE